PRIEFSAPRSHYRAPEESMLSSRQIFASLSQAKKSLYPEILNSPLDDPGLPRPERAKILGKLAAAYSDHSQFEMSLRAADEMASLGLRDANTAYYRGVGLFFTGKDVPGGVLELETSLKLDPGGKKAYNTLCLMYFQLKKY